MNPALPTFEKQTVAARRFGAETLHRWLKAVRPDITASYDGDRTVSLGPIQVNYLPRAVEIRFSDPYADDNTDVAVYIPGAHTFGAVSTVVDGLLSGWQVTS